MVSIKKPEQKLTPEQHQKLITDVRQLLNEITDFECTVEPIVKTCSIELKPSVLISLPKRDVFESRWIMQAFNTPVYRARRRKRDKSKIEVTYR